MIAKSGFYLYNNHTEYCQESTVLGIAVSNFESLVVCLIKGSGHLALLHVHALAHGGSPSSHWILYVLAQSSMTLWAKMIGFLLLSMQNGIRQQGQHPTRQRITVGKHIFILRIGTIKKTYRESLPYTDFGTALL